MSLIIDCISHYICISDDEIVGASGQFDLKRNKQKKNEVVDILKMIDNDKKMMKHGLKSSKSLESLDVKAPNEVCAHCIIFL